MITATYNIELSEQQFETLKEIIEEHAKKNLLVHEDVKEIYKMFISSKEAK